MAPKADLGLEVIELKPRRANLVALQEREVFVGLAVACARQDARDPQRRVWVVG
jgi:hypothetical protein